MATISLFLYLTFFKISMKGTLIYIVFFFVPVIFIQALSPGQRFEKSVYYKVLENGNVDEVEIQLQLIESSLNINKEAYGGALLMKKAGLIKGASKKLNVFKEGNRKLEGAIKKDNENAEWYFLRLIIQEHAPKILKYHAEVKKDADIVHKAFKKFSPEVQAAIIQYRKNSDSLQAYNF